MPKNPRHQVPADDDLLGADPALEQTDVLPPTPMIGGKYRLGRLLGEGGMGAVYAAEHTGLGTRVAVKLLNEVFTTDPSAVQRFRREARAAAAIRHPNVVEVTDTGTDDETGVPFIVMELLEGESLSSLLRRERVLSPGTAALVVSQILAGLAAAHEKGVIHRDLKPGNILLARTPDGGLTVKLLDFGISKFYENAAVDVTATGAVIGTPRFMAPEQARGESDLDARVDIYAVGVLFYRMVTGKLPFAATTQDEVIRLILEGRMTPPRTLRPEIPTELEAVILRAMATDRAERYSDARAFFAELQQAIPDLLAGGTIQVTAHTGITGAPTPYPLSLSGSLGGGTRPTGASTAASLAERSTRPASPHALRGERRWLRHLILPAVLLVGLGGFLGWYLWSRNKSRGVESSVLTGPKLRFGITRYLPETQLVKEHAALVKYLQARLQRPVELKVCEDYIDLSSQLAAGELEMAALTSYAYVRAKRKWPALRLLATHVTSGSPSYEGYIVAKVQSGIETLQDLKGKVFCYVGPNSTSGYLYPRALFRRYGIDPDKTFRATRFTGDHLAALKALESGACDGAAVFAGIFFEAKRHGISPHQYTILATTARIPYDAYCVPPSMKPAVSDQLRDALLALKEGSELTRKVLGEKSRITGFAPVQDADYDSVRRIEHLLDMPTTKREAKTP
jgi:phosphate/phosphite/phosphonate ABC transporter binding protein